MSQIKVEPNQTATAIRETLWNSDEYLNISQMIGPTKHPLGGLCYLASETFHELACRDDAELLFQEIHWVDEELGSGLKCPHWYLKDGPEEFIDLTAGQFKDNQIDVDYTDGSKKEFVQPKPSAKAQKLIQEIRS